MLDPYGCWVVILWQFGKHDLQWDGGSTIQRIPLFLIEKSMVSGWDFPLNQSIELCSCSTNQDLTPFWHRVNIGNIRLRHGPSRSTNPGYSNQRLGYGGFRIFRALPNFPSISPWFSTKKTFQRAWVPPWQTSGYGSIPINTIFSGMNIHLPAILMFTRGTRFWHTAICWFVDVPLQSIHKNGTNHFLIFHRSVSSAGSAGAVGKDGHDLTRIPHDGTEAAKDSENGGFIWEFMGKSWEYMRIPCLVICQA